MSEPLVAYSMGGHYAVWLSEDPAKKIKKKNKFQQQALRPSDGFQIFRTLTFSYPGVSYPRHL